MQFAMSQDKTSITPPLATIRRSLLIHLMTQTACYEYSRPLNLYHMCIYIVIRVIVVTYLPLYRKSGNDKRQLCVNTELKMLKSVFLVQPANDLPRSEMQVGLLNEVRR